MTDSIDRRKPWCRASAVFSIILIALQVQRESKPAKTLTFFPYQRSVILDSTQTGAKFRGNDFTGAPREYEIHDLVLSRRKLRDVVRRGLAPCE